MPEIEYTTTRIPITLDNLPEGVNYEADGSAWRAVPWAAEPNGWRWQPMNWQAFAKERPEGEMVNFFMPERTPPAEPIEPDEQEALDRFKAHRALEELKRRHPGWADELPCPDCGSFDHFECGR